MRIRACVYLFGLAATLVACPDKQTSTPLHARTTPAAAAARGGGGEGDTIRKHRPGMLANSGNVGGNQQSDYDRTGDPAGQDRGTVGRNGGRP